MWVECKVLCWKSNLHNNWDTNLCHFLLQKKSFKYILMLRWELPLLKHLHLIRLVSRLYNLLGKVCKALRRQLLLYCIMGNIGSSVFGVRPTLEAKSQYLGMKAATRHTSRNMRGERNREEMIPLIFLIENISQLKRKHWKDQRTFPAVPAQPGRERKWKWDSKKKMEVGSKDD